MEFTDSDIGPPSDAQEFLKRLEGQRIGIQAQLDKARQSELGQYFTPPSIAIMMAEMFTDFPETIHLLDAGAGVGTLTAAFVANAILSISKPKQINVTAFEFDPSLIDGLLSTLKQCQSICDQNQVEFHYQIRQEDFIASSAEILASRDSLFSFTQPSYNFAILNPPYKKINSQTKTRRLLNAVGIETTNLYSAFLWLAIKLLDDEGEMVAIVPRSFCNGTYFRPFRLDFLATMSIRQIHVYESRDKAFREGEVLQENIILHSKKIRDSHHTVSISSSKDPEDSDIKVRELNYDQLVHPNDPDSFIRIIPDQLGHQISLQIDQLTTTLKELGISVSTGQVVDFRSKNLIRPEPDDEVIPLIYPGNIRNGAIQWPLAIKNKSNYLASSHEVSKLVIPSYYYVLVKRFSSKEEKRRIYAALYDPIRFPVNRIAIENHLNYFHSRYGGLSKELAKGLVLFLNSTWVDEFFRQFSGHTQVNATDLRNMRYPTADQLIELGQKMADEIPDQDVIDQLVAEIISTDNLVEETMPIDPIQAKKKIKEALSILKMLNVPKAQQNDRSALTLLALLNLLPQTPWSHASKNLVGISEMMEFFKANYGINYAPNTRETVRRQTIHQFIQLGLVIANPDDPSRPINSPKTRYIIHDATIELIRSYGTDHWDSLLVGYLRATPSLASLQVRERTMPMIPVYLPDGDRILLTEGGQNELIKKIIEEFCSRFTPGGEVVYIGDAGKKLTEKEIEYFEGQGIVIDRHGKMPDVIVEYSPKNWLVLIEAVTSHGPIDVKRHNELKQIFSTGKNGLVFVTAFETRKALNRYLTQIAWETEVWVAEEPSHIIHFNGERFLGPYED